MREKKKKNVTCCKIIILIEKLYQVKNFYERLGRQNIWRKSNLIMKFLIALVVSSYFTYVSAEIKFNAGQRYRLPG